MGVILSSQLHTDLPGAAGILGRDLVLTDTDFARICQLIYDRAGIVLADNKREMVYSRLAKRLRLHGISHFGDYLDRLARQPAAREWEAFTNALTTNLTAFFREAHHFPLLAQHIAGRSEPVRIWCAAASTGEEPYSIAMTLLESLPASVASQSQVIATDIDTDALPRPRSASTRSSRCWRSARSGSSASSSRAAASASAWPGCARNWRGWWTFASSTCTPRAGTSAASSTRSSAATS